MNAPVPPPQVLEYGRDSSDDRKGMTLVEHRGRAQRLEVAPHETCERARPTGRCGR